MVRFVALLLLGPSLLLAGCGGGSLSGADTASAAVVGREASTALRDALQKELGAAIASDGLPGGVRVCAKKAPGIGEAVQRQLAHPAVLEITRVTVHPRNPRNRADARDREALQALADPATEHVLLPAEGAGQPHLFYHAVRVKPICLSCHGDPTGFDPTLKQNLAAHYPGDEATGYHLDDLRGAIRVALDPEHF